MIFLDSVHGKTQLSLCTLMTACLGVSAEKTSLSEDDEESTPDNISPITA